jgi:hypothetical protein
LAAPGTSATFVLVSAAAAEGAEPDIDFYERHDLACYKRTVQIMKGMITNHHPMAPHENDIFMAAHPGISECHVLIK